MAGSQTPVEIRTVEPDDGAAINELYTAAFPDEELLPLVKALAAENERTLCLIAISGEAAVGHVVFTLGTLTPASSPPESPPPDSPAPAIHKPRDTTTALLGPLAVAPAHQRHGIGMALVGEGLHRLRAQGVSQVHVLGDPAYYARFGFAPCDGVVPPYNLPEEWRQAWQCLQLDEGPAPTGRLRLPDCWMHRALWLP